MGVRSGTTAWNPHIQKRQAMCFLILHLILRIVAFATDATAANFTIFPIALKISGLTPAATSVTCPVFFLLARLAPSQVMPIANVTDTS